MSIDLSKLREPFPEEDIEWRVSRAGMGSKGIYCHVLAYLTARAVQQRLDDVCGPENWRMEEPRMLEFQPGKLAFACGLSIRINDEWVTKWDVSEPTNIEPAKGGWSGAVKRAGAAWGVGRFLYSLDETFAEVSETPGKGKEWNWAKLPERQGGGTYYWKAPKLPAWALPKEPEHEISEQDLNDLKKAWRDKFLPESKNPAELREGFERFVHSVCGDFPVSDRSCWIRDSWEKCMKRIEETNDAEGVSADVPFE